ASPYETPTSSASMPRRACRCHIPKPECASLGRAGAADGAWSASAQVVRDAVPRLRLISVMLSDVARGARRFAALGVLLALGGCTIPAGPPVGYTSVTYGDPYYDYPRTVYDGRTVYYVDHRWVYRDADRWYYYRSEPPALHRYRSTVRQAPPAHVVPAPG